MTCVLRMQSYRCWVFSIEWDRFPNLTACREWDTAINYHHVFLTFRCPKISFVGQLRKDFEIRPACDCCGKEEIKLGFILNCFYLTWFVKSPRQGCQLTIINGKSSPGVPAASWSFEINQHILSRNWSICEIGRISHTRCLTQINDWNVWFKQLSWNFSSFN